MSWLRGKLSPYGPVKWFGGRVTHYWFGWDIRTARGYLCIHHRRGCWWPIYAYWSRDATPPGAPYGNDGRWLFGRRAYWRHA